MDELGAPELALGTLRCIECDLSWVEPTERWRVYLTDDALPEPVAYCEQCAAREFGPPRRRSS